MWDKIIGNLPFVPSNCCFLFSSSCGCAELQKVYEHWSNAFHLKRADMKWHFMNRWLSHFRQIREREKNLVRNIACVCTHRHNRCLPKMWKKIHFLCAQREEKKWSWKMHNRPAAAAAHLKVHMFLWSGAWVRLHSRLLLLFVVASFRMRCGWFSFQSF